MAYDRLEPIGAQADRYQMATLIAMMSDRRVRPEDFMPGEASRRVPPSRADVVTKGRAIFGALAAAQQAKAEKVN